MKVVRVLVVEDEAAKRQEIEAEISDFFGDDATVTHCDTFGVATQHLLQTKFDLIVVDLLLPRRAGELPVDVSEEMIEHLTASEVNRLATVVAISKFEDVVAQRRSEFTKAGIFLIRFQAEIEWKACLQVCMQRAAFSAVYDFVILCALELERTAFEGVSDPDFEIGDLLTINGLDVQETRIGELRGVIVLQPRMGLVDASIIATRALEAFKPKLVCMAGICGGFAGEVPLGALVVSEITWEHQAGKWRGDQFEIRSYQEPLDNDIQTILSQMIKKDQKLLALASKSHEIQMPEAGAFIRPTVSGSAVIASSRYAGTIQGQHGKVAAIDMEVYGVHRAAALYGQPIACFAAKTVVDHADEAKGDDLQHAGAILSARFVVRATKQLFAQWVTGK